MNHHVAYHTVQLLIEDVQFGIGIVENLVDLHVESVMLLSHCLHRILLVDAVSYQWVQTAILSIYLHLLRRLIAPEGQPTPSTFHDSTRA